jgi:hypothetical protein
MTNDEITKMIISAVQGQADSYLREFMTWQLVVACVVIGMVVLLGAYLRQKGKEYAKREDIDKITKIVEGIKLDNAKDFEKLAQENRLALSAFEQKNDLRLAALDRRLEAHQKAYSLWYRLIGSVHKESVLWDMMQECNGFWMNNSLYLTEESRKAFDEAVHAASMHQAVKQEGDAAKTKENWNRIFRAGEVFVKSVSLPSLGEKEIFLSKTEKAKG